MIFVRLLFICFSVLSSWFVLLLLLIVIFIVRLLVVIVCVMFMVVVMGWVIECVISIVSLVFSVRVSISSVIIV